MNEFSITDKTNKKRWFGFSDKSLNHTLSALLVYWDVEPIGDKKIAHIYATGQTIQGDLDTLLAFVAEKSKINHKQLTGKDAPKPIKRSENPGDFLTFAFFTNALLDEARANTTEQVFYQKKGKTNEHTISK